VSNNQFKLRFPSFPFRIHPEHTNHQNRVNFGSRRLTGVRHRQVVHSKTHKLSDKGCVA